MPLFLRKERGKLALTKAKISQTELERLLTNKEIQNQIMASYNQLVILEKQVALLNQLVENYVVLRNAEIEKFSIGESSLFLVNSRETKLIEARIKVAKQIANYQKAKAQLLWAAGVPNWTDFE
jgi:outer membrane protein TolC